MNKAPAMRSLNLAHAPKERFEELIARHSGLDAVVEEKAQVTGSLENGYAPVGYTLADFTILRHQGTFHLFHIPRVPGQRPILRCHEHWIGHAVSQDLDTWTTLNPALCVEPANDFESGHVWAPFVVEHEGVLWLVAYFEGNGINRLFIGTLDLHASPWTLRRVRSAPELDRWQGLLG